MLPLAALSLLLLPLLSYAGHWVITLDGSTTVPGTTGTGNYTFANSQVTGPNSWSATNHIYFDVSGGSCSLGLPGSLSTTATLTWTPDSPTDTSQPPPTVDVLETASAGGAEWMLQPTGVSTDASDGFDDPVTYATEPVYGASSSGRHLYHMTVSPGQMSVTLPTRSLSASLTYETAICTSSTNEHMGYSAQVDSYQVTLSRDGARGETQDPDGTKHGDTIYSYGDYINTEDTGLEKRTDYLNWQTFQPNFVGNWSFPQGSSPYWAWTPSESDDTSTMGKVSMHYRNYYTLEGEPNGSDSAETRAVSYSVTDPLGATATANYVLTVHDPYESYINNHRLKLKNYQRQPNSPSWTSSPAATTGDVFISQENSWGGSVSLDSFGELICQNLGLSISTNYSFSVTAGAYAHAGPLTPGYTTWALTYDEYDEYYGTLKVWDAGGYVGTTPYDEQIPNGQIGIIAAPPVWTGGGNDPGDPFPSP